jgi:hypothetical protein
LSDAGGAIVNTDASPVNLTITADITAGWTANVVTLITVYNPNGMGIVSLVPDTGVTLLGPPSFTSSGTRALATNGQCVLSRISTNYWTVAGPGIS